MSQMRLFDGQSIGSFRAKFGTVDIDDEDADDFYADAELVLVVKITVDGASTRRLQNGEWQRTNALSVGAMRVATGAMRNQLIEFFGFTDQLSLPVDLSSLRAPGAGSSSVSTSVHRETGEVVEPGRRDPALASFLAEEA